MRLELAAGHGASGAVIADDYPRKPLLEVGGGLGKAEDRHDLAGNGDVKSVVARDAVLFAAEPVADTAKLAVVHINAAAPSNSLGVDAKLVALHDVVIDHRGEQVVCGTYRVDIAGKMQVNILHRHYLRIAASTGSALYAEHRTERRLAQRRGGAFPDMPQRIGKPYRSRGLALARGSRCDGGDKNELPLPARTPAQVVKVYLCLEAPIVLKIFFVYIKLLRNFPYRAHAAALCNSQVGISVHRRPPRFSVFCCTYKHYIFILYHKRRALNTLVCRQKLRSV